VKFSGKNFQPWPDFSLDIEGLTIVVGPSNEGKSALYRALMGILRNELDVAFIRNPKEEPLELTLEHNGVVVKAVRPPRGKVVYTITKPGGEPEDFSSLDGDVPAAVKEFKTGDIRVGEYSFDPIFASQNRPQFLIDSKTFKPGEINALFGAFGGTEKLEAGKKAANLQKNQKDGEAKVLAGQIRASEERKARLGRMSEDGHLLSAGLHASEGTVRQLEGETAWLAAAAGRVRRAAALKRIADSLEVPDTAPLESLESTAAQAEQAAQSGAFAKWASKPLQAIEGATAAWNLALGAWRVLKALEAAAALAHAHIDTSELAALQGVSTTGLERLQSSIVLLEQAAALRRSLKETAAQLAETDESLAAAQRELADAQRALHDAEVDAERRRAEELTARGICPKCGQPLEHTCRT
jgi:hypothetical protein